MHSRPASLDRRRRRYAALVIRSPSPRAVAAVSAVSAAAAVLVAMPVTSASAATPEGWGPTPDVDMGFVLWALIGLPVLAFLVIWLLVYLPAMVRGERLTPGAAVADDQWLGGPRRSIGELAGPDTAESKAGGASARW